MTKPYVRQLAREFYEKRCEGWNDVDIANYYDRSESGVRGGISEYKALIEWESQQTATKAPIEFPKSPHDLDDPLPKLKQSVKPTAIRSLTGGNHDTDDFNKRYNDLKQRKRFITVFFPFDKHIPFHDKDAIALDHVIMRDIGADIIVHGSDVFDFPTISRHQPDYELRNNPSFDDVYYNVERDYRYDTDLLASVGGAPLIPFIYGNHDRRFVDMALESDAPRLLIEQFISMVRNEGTVHYLGLTQELLLDTLFIRHDGGISKHTAATMLSRDNSVHHVAGHTHRSDYFSHTSKLFRRHSMVVGCRCDLNPHYQTKLGKHTSNWNQSLGFCILDTQTGNAQMYDLEYYRDGSHIYAMNGSDTYKVQLSHDNESNKLYK
jgi:hypothetical protein